MSGSDSYIGNAGVPVPPMADVKGTDMYAPPPMAVVAAPNPSEPHTLPAATYYQPTGVFGGYGVVQLPSIANSNGNKADVTGTLPMAVVAPPNPSEPPSHALPAASGGSAVVLVPSGEGIKRKRGRPRKNAPTEGAPVLTSGGFGAAPAVAMGAQASSGRARGRPRGSGKKKQKKVVAPAGSTGAGLTVHVITVQPGEDVQEKVMSVFQNTTDAICVLSANGVISSVTLRRPATSVGTVTIEGRFDILSLSGSFLLFESGGQRRRSGGLTVSLAGLDGHVLGGNVAGLLTAASPIQPMFIYHLSRDQIRNYWIRLWWSELHGKFTSPPIQCRHYSPGRLCVDTVLVVVTSFIPEDPQATYLGNRQVYHALPNLASGASMVGSPPSRATLSGSSGGPGSPLNYRTGGCNNINPLSFANIGWR